MISASIGNTAVKNAVSVVDYGADHTGSRDSSAAFAAAAQAADDKSGGYGGAVYVPPGRYIVADAPLDAGTSVDSFHTRPITYIGAGSGQTFITVEAGEVGFSTTKSGTVRGGGVIGMTITGDGNSAEPSSSSVEADWYDSATPANAATTTAILVSNGVGNEVFDFIVEGCDIKNHRYGVRFVGRCRSPKFTSNNIWYCWQAINAPEHPFFAGVNDLRYNYICYTAPGTSSDTLIFDCIFSGVKFMYSHYGLIHEDEATGVNNCTFTGCIFGMNKVTGVLLASENNVANNYFITVSSGFTQDEAVKVIGRQNVINNNNFESFGVAYSNAVINVNPSTWGESFVTICGNQFNSRAGAGAQGLPIKFSTASGRFDGAVISDNTVAMNNGTGTQFIECTARLSYSTISGNTLKAEGSYAEGTGHAISLGSGSKYNTVSGNSCFYGAGVTSSTDFFYGYGANSTFIGNSVVRSSNATRRGFQFLDTPGVYSYDLSHDHGGSSALSTIYLNNYDNP